MNKAKRLFPIVLLLFCQATLTGQATHLRQLSIDEVFELADANSRSFRVYDYAEQEARQAVAVAKNAKLPSLDVSLSASYLGDGRVIARNFSESTNAPIPSFGNNFTLEASQVIYAGGAISGSIEIAKLGQQLAALDKEQNRQEIRFLLASYYLGLYKLYNQKEVYKKNLEQTEVLLKDIRAKQMQGLVLKNDITRYELELQTLQLALQQAKNNIVIYNHELVTVLGLPEETVIEPVADWEDTLPDPGNETHWQDNAFQESPLLQQAKLYVEQSGQQERIARAERLPSVTLFATNQLSGPITIEIPAIDKNFNYWYAGVSVKFNLASLYKSGKSIAKAKFATRKARENEALLQDNLRTEIKSAYVYLQESFIVYETQRKSLELATQNYQVINNRYLNDLALITDMLDASNAKLNAELQVANAKANILLNYCKLKRTVGGL